MTSNKKLIYISGVIILMLTFVWLFSGDGKAEKKDSGPFVSSNWGKEFQNFDKDPLGLYLFNNLVETHLNKSKSLYQINTGVALDSMMTASKEDQTYLFVGNVFGLEDDEINSIMSRVKKGSDLFLSYTMTTSNIMRNFFEDGNYELQVDYSENQLVFTDTTMYKMYNIYQNDTVATEWNAFGEIEPRAAYKSLSGFMEMDNFIVIKIGKGRVYLHTNPMMFFNYQIKRKSGFKYTEYVLSHLPKDQDVLILELGRLSDNYGKHDVSEQDGGEGKEDDSYLKIIFQDPMLLTALLLLILGLILFIVFRSKRVRPIVPYKEKPTNMTLAFTDTITSIYFAKRNPFGLLQVQRKNFYATIQKHFFVDLSRRQGDREMIILAEKTNKPLQEIKGIVEKLENKEATRISDQDITNMAHIQRTFYREVGIIPESIIKRLDDKEKIFRRGLLLPVLLILGGVSSIFFGLYLLVNSNGVGIVLWPAGIAMLALGSIRLSNPYIRVKDDKITFYGTLGGKKVYSVKELIGSEMKQSGAVLKFTNGRLLIINYWDLSRFDRNDFDLFIAKLHTLEL